MCCFSRICDQKKKVTNAIGSEARVIKLNQSWKSRLHAEFDLEYMKKLRSFLIQQKQLGKKIYPPGDQIFNALNSTPFENTKVVVLGQDPYHQEGQAMGLCFSVPVDIKIPPSLVNIFKELYQDLGIQ